MALSPLEWLREVLTAPTPDQKAQMRALEAGQALLARGKPDAALYHLRDLPTEDPPLLASFLDVMVRAALAMRDLLALEGLALHAETLGRLRPEKARLLMLEAEAVGALGLAKGLAEGMAASGASMGEDLLRIQKRRRRRPADEGYLTIARTALGGAFEELRLVGIGRASYVVSAVPADREYRVAIKFLGPARYLDEKGRRRFEREATLLRQLDDPAILELYRYVDQEPPYMVMEFFPGTSLDERLRQCEPVPREAALDLGIRLADALHHAHAKGIFHRNVTPANIMMGGGKVKLIGFGLAKTNLGWEISAEGSVLGEWAYSPPEQYHGEAESPTPQLDVFGLAATLHHLLLGEPPYRRGRRVLRERSPALAEALAAHPGGLFATLERALLEDPKARLASARELGEELRKAHLRKGGETP